MTNDLDRRLYEHKHKLFKGYTEKYNIDRLVYFEQFDDIEQAIARESQLKDWRREKKVALIEGMNPDWKDLSETWNTEVYSISQDGSQSSGDSSVALVR